MSEPKGNGDIQVLRELAKQVAEIAAKPIQDERRRLWRQHNSLNMSRPPILMRWFACGHEIIGPAMRCEDPLYAGFEHQLRTKIFHDTLDDDFIVEPWVTLSASKILPGKGAWGLEPQQTRSEQTGGAFHIDPVIVELEDAEKLVKPQHMIDEEATARNAERIRDAIGDIIEVDIDRAPLWRVWNADLATVLGRLRGLDNLMLDMMDEPEWLHEVLAFMRDGVLAAHEEAEEAGDWRLAQSENQSMPYAEELADPKANSEPVERKDLWIFLAAQELTLVSPAQHDEFMYRYQMPIMEKFGLAAYGCCEDLTLKMDMVKQLPNLRRIAVTPVADVKRCAEQIGPDYVASWRPNPAETVCCGFKPEKIRDLIRRGAEAFYANDCPFDICLKDIQTVEKEPHRLGEFVRIAREACEEAAGTGGC